MSTIYWIHYPEHTDPFTQGYVGVSVNPVRRFNQHTKNRNSNNRMVSGAIAKGAVQSILHVCDSVESALLLERSYRPNDLIGWNIIAGGGMPPSQAGRKRSLDTIAKISSSHVGIKISVEAIEKRKKHLIGRTVREDTKQKISAANKGKVRSAETKQKLSESHRGMCQSEDTRRKKSETCKKSSYVKSISQKICTPLGIFSSIRECSRLTGLSTSAIRYRLKHNSGWSYVTSCES